MSPRTLSCEQAHSGRAAEKALLLDPQSAEAHVSLAFVRSSYEWDWASGDSLYRRAIELNPGYSRAHHWYGSDFLAIQGRFDEALSEVLTAYHLDPLSPILVEGIGFVHTLRREYETALREYQKLVKLDPLFYKAYSSMGRTLSLMGRYEEAVASFERARALAGDVPNILSATAQTLAAAGFVWEARTLLERLQAMGKSQWIPSSSLAIVQIGLGDREAALTLLEAACDKREWGVLGLKVHPLFDPLRSEPRFQRMLERIGFLP
jgi:tetratricopeptide (TPR) repeat protein